MPKKNGVRLASLFLAGIGFLLPGCATHADVVELRNQVSKSHGQDQRRLDPLQRRVELLEKARADLSGASLTDPKIEELVTRIQQLEGRFAKLDEAVTGSALSKMAPGLAESTSLSKPQRPASAANASIIIPGVPTITPTSAFNLAYNDYLNGKYDLATAGFERFVKDFSSSSLTPNVYYWLGESAYQQNDYVRAVHSFEYLVTEYPKHERVPAALFKIGIAAEVTGDLPKSRAYLKRVIEEFSLSDEAKLAKGKLASPR